MLQGRHKGVRYRLKFGIRGEWVWEADMPDKPRLGRVYGPRDAAVAAVVQAIDSWDRNGRVKPSKSLNP